jgi:hypothetical protein
MRIIIELEGIETTVKKEQTMPPGLAPSEVLTAAAAVGAFDAGPAPNVAAQPPGVPPLPSSMSGPGAPAAGVGDLPAGAAPII